MNKVLATDLDGTLFYPRHFFRCIPKRNVHFLRKWIDNGNRLVLISSRGPDFMERLKKEIDRDFDFISYTSSYIVADNKVIKDVSIKGEVIKEILEYVSKVAKPVAYLANIKGQPMLIKDNLKVGKIILLLYKLYWIIQGKKRERYILNKKYFNDHVFTGRVYKVMLFYGLKKKNSLVAKELNKDIREKFPEVESSWSSIINELTPKNCYKGEGLKFYCNYLKIDKNDVIVVGDSGNDITMFNEFYDNSYVMAKASPSVKKYAKHTISRVYKLKDIVLEKE